MKVHEVTVRDRGYAGYLARSGAVQASCTAGEELAVRALARKLQGQDVCKLWQVAPGHWRVQVDDRRPGN